MKNLKRAFALYTVLTIGWGTPAAQAGLVYVTEEDQIHTPAFYLNADDTSDDFVDLNFGTASGAQLRYDVVDDDFTLNRVLDLTGNQLVNFEVENLAAAPTCDGTTIGRMYYNTTTSQTFVCDGASFNVLENGAVTGSDITDGTIDTADLADDSVTSAKILDSTIVTADVADGTITAADLNLTDIDLADFTNTPGFVTTDNDTTYTGGTGITLTGTVFSNDLGTDIQTGEIGDDQVTVAKIGGAGNNQVLTSDGSGNPQWEDKSNFATSSLTTNNIFVGVGGVATDTAVSGDLSMIGGDFQIAANAVGSTEIADDAVSDAEIDFANVTLADFTNDAGFVTTDNDTTYTGSGGVTLTGTNFTADLGTDIVTGEIVDGTITAADLNLTDITLSDLTNDAGFVTTDNDTTYTGSGGVTLTGTNFTADLGTDIATAEIQDNAVDGTKLGIGTTAGDTLYFDGTDWVRLGVGTAGQVLTTNAGATAPEWAAAGSDTLGGLSCTPGQVAKWNGSAWACAADVDTDTDTTYTGSGGVTLTGTNFTADLGTDIVTGEIVDGTITAADLNLTDIDLADFTNTPGFITTDTDTTYTGSGGVTLTGTNFTADLGTSIDASEIDTDAVNDDEINYTNVTLADFTNDAGFVTTDNDTTYTGGTGITLTGTVFSNDLGTDIDASELVADAVQDSEIDYTAVTLADFTNDAGFVTTDNDTTYTASDGITLTGTNFTNNFSTAIETGEITDGTITFADLNNTDITLSDFTNDLALNSANIFVGNASNIASAVTVTGDVSISNIGAFTINDNSVDGTDIALGGDTAGDVMFYNGVDWSRLGIGTAGQVLQVNTGATAPEWTSAAATDGIQDANGDTQVQVEESANDDTIRFDTNGNEVMTVGPNGNVVINSAVSGVELDIAGQVRMDSLTVDNSTAAILGTTGSNYALRRNVDDNKLIVAGGNASNAGGNIHMFGGAHASLPNTVQFNSGTDETMRIEGDGDVLIGAAAETIDNAAFVMDGNDMFIAGDLGVEGAIYTDATATKYQTIDIFGCVRGSASSGTVAGGNSAVVRFDGGNNSQMRCSFAVPDDWVAGTDINIETYYSPSDNTTGDVQFQLRHAAKAVGEVIANGDFVDTVAGAETIAVNTELEMYELVEDIPAATLALDDMVNINLRRVPGNAADTYGGDINIHMLRIAYTGKRLE